MRPIPDRLRDLAFRVVPRLHRALMVASAGRLLGSFSGMPVVELHTVGRRSGLRRTTVLTAPLHDASRVVLVASKGGDRRQPEWFLNLSAHPDVELTMAGRTSNMRARVASDAERERLWPQIVSSYGGYGGYQRRTPRRIPVVILEPRRS